MFPKGIKAFKLFFKSWQCESQSNGLRFRDSAQIFWISIRERQYVILQFLSILIIGNEINTFFESKITELCSVVFYNRKVADKFVIKHDSPACTQALEVSFEVHFVCLSCKMFSIQLCNIVPCKWRSLDMDCLLS